MKISGVFILRLLGVIVLLIGIVLLGSFISVTINPPVSSANLGLLSLLFGIILIAAASTARRAKAQSLRQTAGMSLGWSLLALGAIVSLSGFLLSNQVICSCPASGPCSCGVLLYILMFYGGLFVALAGGALIIINGLISRKAPPIPQEAVSATPNVRGGKRKVVALAVVIITIGAAYATFSIYPGVYITSTNDQIHFLNGLPEPTSMASLISSSQPASGFGVNVAGSFSYTLVFNSEPSYPEYRINSLSVTQGFTITSINTSIPLTIGASNPSVSVTIDLRAPFYPYYGTFSLFLTIEQLNVT